jgi:hypothetical protein
MAWKRNVLVIANVTATSDQLLDALRERAAEEPVAFMLVVPATPFGGGRAPAVQKLHEAIEQARASGLELEGMVGAADPMNAVVDAWDPTRYDEIIVSTLPMNLSKWLRAGLPERIANLTGAPVTHVISDPPKRAPATEPAPERERRGVIAPLAVLAWGGHREQ